MRKILCICRYGNIRSVALARLLKKERFDALACGIIPNAKDTLQMLMRWADKILVVETSLIQFLPEGFEKKIVDMEIGEDVWHDPFNSDLELVTKRAWYANKARILYV